jgi:hypothetical protein
MPDRITVRCSDGITRTGTVAYIHPDQIFVVVQFEFFKESFLLHRHDRECQSLDHFRPEAFCRTYTPEEDAEIMKSADLTETARKLGRTECGVTARQTALKNISHRHRFTAEEDCAVMESGNLYQTAKKLHRTEGTLSQRRKTLRRRMQSAQK